MTTHIRITRVTDPDDLGHQIAPRMTNLGRAIGTRMQRLVPKRTWALHDTITAHEAEVTGARVSVEVSFGGGTVDYGPHVEYGTSRMAAQPFARPALAQATGADLRYSGAGPTTKGAQDEATAAKRESARERRNARRRANYIGSAKR